MQPPVATVASVPAPAPIAAPAAVRWVVSSMLAQAPTLKAAASATATGVMFAIFMGESPSSEIGGNESAYRRSRLPSSLFCQAQARFFAASAAKFSGAVSNAPGFFKKNLSLVFFLGADELVLPPAATSAFPGALVNAPAFLRRRRPKAKKPSTPRAPAKTGFSRLNGILSKCLE